MRLSKDISAAIGWDTTGYSKQSFSNDCAARFSFPTLNAQAAAGLSSSPSTSASYVGISYCIVTSADKTFSIYEAGVSIGNFGGFSIDDTFEVEYQATAIFYKKNAVIIHTSVATAGLTLFFDSSINTPGAQVSNIIFGKYSSSGNISGQLSTQHVPIGIMSDTTTYNYAATTVSASVAALLTETSFAGSVTPPAPDVTIGRIHILNLTVQNNDSSPGKIQIRLHRSGGGTYVGSGFFSPSAHTGGQETFTVMLFDLVAANAEHIYTATYSLIDGSNGAWSSAPITLSLTHLIHSPMR